MARRVGISTGGGDAPGLNAVIRAFVKYGTHHHGLEVVGIEDAFDGLLSTPRRTRVLTPVDCRGLVHLGGTVLGTTNRGNPFSYRGPDGVEIDRSPALRQAVAELDLEGIVCIGGDGTQAIAHQLMTQVGINVVGVPKTIDNDLGCTDRTFGFQSAVDVATEGLDRLRTTAESHDRVMFLEVMGRDTGHIALHTAIAGGADVCLLPEIPYDPDRVADKIASRAARGITYTIVVVAEGALPIGSDTDRKARIRRGGGAAAIAMAQLEGRVDAEMRVTVLGHLQRGGSPCASDRILATRYGVGAVDLVVAGRWGDMVTVQGDKIGAVPIEMAIAAQRTVDVHGELVTVARATGIAFGD